MNIIPEFNINHRYKDCKSNSILNARNIIVNDTGEFIKAEDVAFYILSSDTTVENLDCQYCKLNSVDGDITIEKSIIDHLKVNTVSGDVNVDGQIANSSSDTISGDIYINGEKKKISFPFR